MINRSNNTSKPKSRLNYVTDKKARSGKVSPVCQKTDHKNYKTGLKKVNKSKFLKVGGQKKFKSKLDSSNRNASKLCSDTQKTMTGSEKIDRIIAKTKGSNISKPKKISGARRSQEYDETDTILDIKRAHSKSHKAYKGNMQK